MFQLNGGLEIMEQVDKAALAGLVKSRLNQARNALDANDLDEAQRLFEKARDVEGEHSERDLTVQRMLIDYCERVSAQQPPNWDYVHRALDLLEKLSLVDEQSESRRREFQLREAESWLTQENLDKAFSLFADLMEKAEGSETPNKRIAELVRVYLTRRLSERPWPFLGEVVDRLKVIWPRDDKLHDWLETTSSILTAAAEQEERLRRYHSLNYALTIAIAAVLVLAVVLVLLVP
jgi:hypothetical protein